MTVRQATAVWIALGVATCLALMLPASAVPGDRLGLRRFHTPAVSDAARVSQTFEMTADGLEAIEFEPVAVGAAPSGRVRLSLVELAPSGDRTIATTEARVQDLLGHGRYRFAFPRIARSRGRSYRFDIRVSATEPAQNFGVAATKGARYDGGTLIINNAPRWADMAFLAVAPSLSIWKALLSSGASPPGVRQAIVIAAFAVTWLALGVALRAVVAFQQP